MNKPEKIPSVTAVAEQIAEAGDCDVVLCNGGINRPLDTQIIESLVTRQCRKNLLFILVTSGGDADTAYRIARTLQDKYDRFELYVTGFCKSAGTLIALGAHGLVFSDHGELGPLDIQMHKKDDLLEMQSGLTVMATLSTLHDKAFLAYEKFFTEIEIKSGGNITVKTASDAAVKLTTGLFASMYKQIDPLHVGDSGRGMAIAYNYGRRLAELSDNLQNEALEFLTSSYPSHGFVIDRREASCLFNKVREPSPEEALLLRLIGDRALFPAPKDQADVEFLTSEPSTNLEDIGENHVPSEEIDDDDKTALDGKVTEKAGASS